MSKRGATEFPWLAVGLGILGFSALFVIALVLSGLGDLPWRSWRAMLSLLLLFAVLGAYYGTIAILDGDSDIAYRNSPFLRTLLCGVLSAIAAFLIQSWPPQSFSGWWVALCFCVGAGLGLLGWKWAKYVDF